ncbi:MAG: FAD-dependent oxidoreductase [Myxococcota bacterium]
MKRIGIVGGGFAGFEAALQLDDALRGRRNVELILFSEQSHFTYTPLLPDVATGAVSMRSVTVRIASALSNPQSRFVRDRIERFELDTQTVVGERGSYPCDYVVIAVGSEPDFQELPGVEGRAMTLQTVHDAMRIKGRLLSVFRRVHAGAVPRAMLPEALTFVIAGGGQAGVELAAEMATGVQQSLLPHVDPEIAEVFRVILIEPSRELLPNTSPALSQRAAEVLARLGVDVRLGARVSGATDRQVLIEGETPIMSEHLIWTAGRRAPRWLADAGVPLTRGGALPVKDDLTVEGTTRTFAAGSCAELVHVTTAIPHSVQVSSRQGALVADNIAQDLVGAAYAAFDYQPSSTLVTLGRLDAAARLGPLSISGVLAQGIYRASHMAQTPTLTKKLAILTDWTEKTLRGRDLGRLMLRMPAPGTPLDPSS